MSQETIKPEDIPSRVKEALVDEFSTDQDRYMQGYVPSQSIQKLMEYLSPNQIQEIKGKRLVKDTSEAFGISGFDLPEYVDAEEQVKRKVVLDYDRAKHRDFDWGRLLDFLVDSDLEDIAISKMVLRMENPDLRDHLFTLLQHAINYPPSYKSEFTDPFYFVMQSKAPQEQKDYRNIKDAHDSGYLKNLGWNPRSLDLQAIWSHHAWTKSGNKPMGVTQHEVEEYAFNRVETDEPVFGAVNSPLVINRWRTPFGRGLTDMRHFKWTEMHGWERVR